MNKINLKKRFVIGSANFTQKYGADPIKIKQIEIKKILQLAKENSIYKIDSAEAYLKNKCFFKKIDKKFKFSSKIIPNPRWVSLEYCQKKIEGHFKNFNTNNIEIILLHDIQILFTKDGPKIFKNLEILKKKNYFKKIGISIYDTNCLNKITKDYDFDVVQCPYNVLDRRIISTGWYDKLKNQGKEIHVRSIFLQGLLVNKFLYKNKYFKKWQKIFINWFQFLEKKNISPVDYCLTDLLSYNFDQVIIGINSYKNLKEIINFKIIDKNEMVNFKIGDTKLIDPRKWK